MSGFVLLIECCCCRFAQKKRKLRVARWNSPSATINWCDFNQVILTWRCFVSGLIVDWISGEHLKEFSFLFDCCSRDSFKLREMISIFSTNWKFSLLRLNGNVDVQSSLNRHKTSETLILFMDFLLHPFSPPSNGSEMRTRPVAACAKKFNIFKWQKWDF